MVHVELSFFSVLLEYLVSFLLPGFVLFCFLITIAVPRVARYYYYYYYYFLNLYAHKLLAMTVFFPWTNLCCYSDTLCTLYKSHLHHLHNMYGSERVFCIQYFINCSYTNICDFKAIHEHLIFQDLMF
jgi:hypothetical protein